VENFIKVGPLVSWL